jgi:adenylosuccinate synthase
MLLPAIVPLLARLLNSIPAHAVRNIWGVGKVYDTYVGQKSFEPSDKVFEKIREIGEEYGATTGRPRQCDWLDVNRLIKSININGITHLVLNKVDVLEKLRIIFQFMIMKKLQNFDDGERYACLYYGKIRNSRILQELQEIYFSGNKNNLN